MDYGISPAHTHKDISHTYVILENDIVIINDFYIIDSY